MLTLVDISTSAEDADFELPRAAGFRSGGVLPRYLNADAFSMQVTLSPPKLHQGQGMFSRSAGSAVCGPADWSNANVSLMVTAPHDSAR